MASLITNLIEIINRTPPHIPINEKRYYIVFRLMTLVGTSIHASFIGLFYFLGVIEIACFQFLSIPIFIAAFYLSRIRKYGLAVLLAAIEIVIHHVYATYLMGVSTLFYLQIVFGALFPFLLPKGHTIIKVASVLLTLTALLFINYFIAANAPVYVLPDSVVMGLSFMNILSIIFLIQVSSSYFASVVNDTETKLALEQQKSDDLLHNILPKDIANELKTSGKVEARQIERATIVFTDFKGFTSISEKLSSDDLVQELNVCFTAFDQIATKYGIEKIKTIGDAYMMAGGLQSNGLDSVTNTVLAALEMQQFIIERHAQQYANGNQAFEMRVGIHTGPVTTGVVGKNKFQYDLWGDTVNTAARMESCGEIRKINISQATYDYLKEKTDFKFTRRVNTQVKGKGMMPMYFVRSNVNP